MKPNFFIVGASKSATTSLHYYLGQHPEIFMSAEKEISYFFVGEEQRDRKGLKEYMENFKDVKDEKIIGETTPSYLYSDNALKEIKEFSPKAKILISLREPVEMLKSLHSQYLFNGEEIIKDFKEAMNSKDNKNRLKKRSSYSTFKEPFYYKDKINYYKYVKRYIDVFGKNNVLIILYDDLKNDTKNTYKTILRFLEVDYGFEPNFKIKNPNKEVKSLFLRKLSRNTLRFFPILKKVVPLNIQDYLRDITFTTSPREEVINKEYENKLRKEFTKDIEELEELINKDLSSWKEKQNES